MDGSQFLTLVYGMLAVLWMASMIGSHLVLWIVENYKVHNARLSLLAVIGTLSVLVMVVVFFGLRFIGAFQCIPTKHPM